MENDPYQIASVADWNAFAAAVNGGYDYSGKYVQLEADVPSEEEIYAGTPALTTMVGVWDATEANRKPFKGTFKGNGKTLIVNYTSNYTSDGNYTAPFRCTNGALITNDLTILGNINATDGYAAGVVGGNYGNKTKINSNVTVSVNITGGGTYCGGIAVDATKLEVSSCTYNGKIVAGDYSAGFCATGGSETKFNKCIFAPEEESLITGEHTENFMNGSYGYSSNYYYTYFETPVVSSTQGACIYESYNDIPDDGKFRMSISLAGHEYYYVEGTCAIIGLASRYYQNNAQHGGITYDVMFNLPGDPAAVVDAECYTAEVLDGSGAPVTVSTIAPGDYTLRITGKKGYCSGSVTSDSFTIVETIFDNGTGTEDDPYEIHHIADWNKFAQAVNDGHSFAGEYLILETSDITITISSASTDKMAGVMTNPNNTLTEDKWFSGTFDGNGNTLTFNVGTSTEGFNSGNDYSPNAPFRVIDGATIKNLTVKGAIYSVRKYSAGFVGFAYNAKTSKVNNIINCTSNIFFYGKFIDNGGSGTGTGNKRYDCSAAGFVAENKTGKIYFNKCIFDGEIVKDGVNYANRGAGFVSYNNGGTAYFTNCAMAGTIGLDYAGTFYRASSNKHEYSNCYYITRPTNQDQEQFDSDNCIQAYTDATIGGLTNEIYKKYVINSTNYYIPGAEITGLETTYSYIEGSPVEITPVVKYYGRTLTRGTDYIIKIDGTEVPTGDTPTLSVAGDYTFTIEGIGNYGGSTETDITVLNINSWSTLKDALLCDSGVFTLNGDIIADTTKETDTTLWVKTGNITLNLNGHTINRGLTRIVSGLVEGAPDKNGPGQVIRIKNGASLTINGLGTITGGFHKGAEGNIDGGGIYNMGNLTLNNVNVIGNKCIKQDGENFSGRGGGIYSGNTASLIITGGEITDNEAIGGGGGIYCYMSNPFNMTGVNIKSNVSEDKGGGIRLVVNNGKTANIINCNIIGNCATVNTESKGGGIYYEGSSNTTSILNLVNDTLQANTSFILGGAIYSHKGTITATNCVMNNNLSFDDEGFWASDDSYGGAVCLYAGSSSSYSTFIMNGGSITGDLSKTNGGGIYVYTHSILQVMGNVIITDNTQMGNDMVSSSNNVYLAGAASGDVIQVIDELGPDAIIGIANSDPGTYIAVADSVSYEHILEHIALDNDENSLIIDENGDVQVYVPYPWNDDDTWDGTIATITEGSYPPTTSNDVTINRAIKIPSGSVACAKNITFGTYGSIIIEDGGQLINNNSVAVVAKKEVVAADAEAKSGWYIISSPVTNPNITSATNLITPVSDARYDLYRFNEAAEKPWENYRQTDPEHSGFCVNQSASALQNGRGYLYRNEHNHIVDISGDVDVASSVNYTLSYTATVGGNDNIFKGFNIIGNPYSHNIAKGEGQAIPNDYLEDDYYVLNSTTGAFELATDGEIIPPLTGILVQAKSASTLTINKVVASGSKGVKADNAEIQFTVSNSDFEDKAFVKFKEGRGLNKIEHLNEEAPMLYIHHNGEDFASVDMNPEAKMFNLNFEAKTMGYYTLSVEPQGEYSYLHLIDKVTEKEIDLLEENEYTFIGSTSDAANRFIVRMSLAEDPEESDNEVFAYQSGDEIVVSGKGELQVFDVMGRFVATYNVSGVQTVTKPITAGVYIVKLNEKTQKIIIK